MISKYCLNILFIILFLTIACEKNPTEIVPTKKNPTRVEEVDGLIPFNVGNSWSYIQYVCSDSACNNVFQGLTDSAIFKISEKKDVEIEGKLYNAAIREIYFPSTGQTSDYKWLFFNQVDGLYLLGGISSSDTLLKRILQLKYPVNAGESWQVPRLVYDLIERRFLIEDTLTYTCISTNEQFETPAGAFDCYVYHHRIRPADDINDYWDYYEYYNLEIGHVGTIIKSLKTNYIIFKILLYNDSIN